MGAGPGKPILDSLSCPRGGEVGLTSPHWTGPMGCPRREVVFGPPPPPPRPPNNFVTIESELIFYCGTSKNRKNVKKNAILANISGRKTPHCRYIGWEKKKKKNLGRRWPKWRRVDGHTWQVALTLGRRQPTTGDALAGLAWHGTTRLEGPGQWWPDLTRQVARRHSTVDTASAETRRVAWRDAQRHFCASEWGVGEGRHRLWTA